jgi:hypothetical protein
MSKEEIKRRLLKRFRKKITGRVIIKFGKKKLAVEYMFGGKYCLKRKIGKQLTILEMLGDIDRIVDLIAKEKARIY